MQIESTIIPDCLLITPKVHGDERGFFVELFQAERYAEMGIAADFVQDNYSRSQFGTLRGLHYQHQRPQGKLVQVMQGEVFDVAVDLRQDSPAFGQVVTARLSDKNRQQLYVPAGCAHGFLVLSETADFLYKCTDFYSPGDEYCLSWNDPELAIPWPISVAPLLSPKDQNGLLLANCPKF